MSVLQTPNEINIVNNIANNKSCCSVLEVNASSRRSGKIMLKDLEEATKSHRVKKGNIDSHFAAVETKVEEKKLPKNSLILLEDVDIVFEEDEGFVSAIAQLTANTKRPIVMTCRNSCSHLSKMAPNQLKIRFQVPTSRRVPALFQLISLAETGHRLPKNSLMVSFTFFFLLFKG